MVLFSEQTDMLEHGDARIRHFPHMLRGQRVLRVFIRVLVN